MFSHVDELKRIGLDVPQVTELAWELRKSGYDISSEIITEEECTAAIMRLFGKNMKIRSDIIGNP